MRAIEAIADDVSSAMRPLLFVDTCSLLDIVRAPIRLDSMDRLSRLLTSVTSLINLAKQSHPRLWMIIPLQVQREFNENIETVVQETIKCIEKTDCRINAFNTALQLLKPGFTPINQPFKSHDLAMLCRNLAESVMAQSVILDEDDACKIKGMDRITSNRAPAKRGGQAKDCTILEHCLELSQQIRNRGSQSNLIFLTSNIEDYCDSSGANLKTPLDVDFSAVNLSLATTWEWASSLLLDP